MNTIASAFLGACALSFFLLQDFLMFKISVGVIVFFGIVEIIFEYLIRKCI